MLTNNSQRLNLWLQLPDRFDFAGFTRLCEAEGVAPLPAMEFAQKVGMLMCASTAYPELSLAEAYLRFIRDNPYIADKVVIPNGSAPIGSTTTVTVKPCGSCGGGRVL